MPAKAIHRDSGPAKSVLRARWWGWLDPLRLFSFFGAARKGGSYGARSGYSSFAPTSRLPGASTRPLSFRKRRMAAALRAVHAEIFAHHGR